MDVQGIIVWWEYNWFFLPFTNNATHFDQWIRSWRWKSKWECRRFTCKEHNFPETTHSQIPTYGLVEAIWLKQDKDGQPRSLSIKPSERRRSISCLMWSTVNSSWRTDGSWLLAYASHKPSHTPRIRAQSRYWRSICSTVFSINSAPVAPSDSQGNPDGTW